VLDVTVMHLLDKVLFSTVIPSKMFEGMAMGIPALSAVPGEAREILEESKAGHYFRAQDSDDFIRVLLDLMSDPDQLVQMKVRCVQAARLFDRTNLATAMAQAHWLRRFNPQYTARSGRRFGTRRRLMPVGAHGHVRVD
jgi:glycosyltransferase involved in cell wall biosynthesis